MWPLQRTQDFSKICPCYLVFDPKCPVFKLILDSIMTNILTKFHEYQTENLVKTFVLMKSRTSSKMGHVGPKTRSLEKPCVHSRGHIFSPILMKLCQNVFLDEISDKFANESVRSKTRSLDQILEKPCVHSRV